MDHDFWSSILRYLSITKSSFLANFWRRHCVWFVVRTHPFQSKILATPMAGMLKFFAKDKRVNSGGARGVGRPASGVTILFLFLLIQKTQWLVGKDLFFFSLVITYFRTENWTPTCFAAKTVFLVFTYILADTGATTKSRPWCHHSWRRFWGWKMFKNKVERNCIIS